MRYLYILLSLVTFMFITSCGSGTGTGSGGTSLVTITIGGSGGNSAAVKQAAAIPGSVSKLAFAITASDMTAITREVLISGQTMITASFNVPNGSNRQFKVAALDSTGKVLYNGETTANLDGTAVTLNINMQYYVTVVAWGSARPAPAGLSGVTAIAAGSSHTVALKDDGTVVAWGDNAYGQTTIPAGLSGVTAIAAGFYHTVALKDDGTVVAWGLNDWGQTTIPAGLSGVTSIAAGWIHTVALKNNGMVVAWGNNAYGQTTIPAGLSGVTAIAAGFGHTVALKNDDTVVAWGNNTWGQMTIPAGLSGVTAIAAGWIHTVALKNNGTVVAWGDNAYGQTTIPAGLSGVTAIAAGFGHTVALIGATAPASAPTFGGLVSAFATSTTEIGLSWEAATDSITPQGSMQYLIYMSTTPGGQSFTSPSFTTSPGATSFSVTELTPATTYYFVVRAKDEAGNIDGNAVERSATTLEQPTPAVGKPFALIGGQSDADLINIFNFSSIPTSPPDSSFTTVLSENTGVILVGDFLLIGINRLGNLNTPATSGNPVILGWIGSDPGTVPLPSMDPAYPGGVAGYAFRENPSLPFEEDVLSPGCYCEGWGVRFSDGATDFDGGAAESRNSLSAPTPVFFGVAYDPAQQARFVRSRVMVGSMEITMDYSLRKGDKFVAERIVLKNTSNAATLSNIRFVRSLDYDVGPGHFDDVFKFLYPIGIPQVIRSRDTEPNDNFYGVATVSPYMTCANGITFMNNDPDYILTADENGNGQVDCGEDPNNAIGDDSSSFVFQPPLILPGGQSEL